MAGFNLAHNKALFGTGRISPLSNQSSSMDIDTHLTNRIKGASTFSKACLFLKKKGLGNTSKQIKIQEIL
jgi:hypothetical protein